MRGRKPGWDKDFTCGSREAKRKRRSMLARSVSPLHKLESSQKRKPQFRKGLPKIGL